MNKGEKSEFYAFLWIINRRKVFFSNLNLNAKKDFIDVQEIAENGGTTYISLTNPQKITINDKNTHNLVNTLNSSFIDANVLNQFKQAIQDNKQFTHEIKIKNGLNIKSAKGNSTKKADFQIGYKFKTIQRKFEGLSVKSSLGGKPTLLNASKQTNIIYEISNFSGSEKDIEDINKIKKFKDKVVKIKKLKGLIKFDHYHSKVFENNLQIIDSSFHMLLADVLLDSYIQNSRTINYLVKNSLHTVYFKRFLRAVALGMVPGTSWNSIEDAKGILNINKSGDILLFHILDAHILEDYLFHSTCFDTPSTTKFKFGKIYQEQNKFYIKLNVHIRMI